MKRLHSVFILIPPSKRFSIKNEFPSGKENSFSKTGLFGTPSQPSLLPPKRRSVFWLVRWVPAAIFIITIFGLLFIVGSSVLVPVLVSFALAYLLYPISALGGE